VPQGSESLSLRQYRIKVRLSAINGGRPDRWKRNLELSKKVLEILAIPFAIGYAFLTYYQWRDLQHNFVIDKRKWTGVKSIGADQFASDAQTVQFPLTITNTGKTPARHVEYYSALLSG
jgi:hypothetical protein